jgi:hypothetical protein
VFTAVDEYANSASCSVLATITDEEKPDLASGDCSGLAVYGVTDSGESYGTEEAGSLIIVYPTVSDNSGVSLMVSAFVGDTNITGNASHRFPYVGIGGHVTTTVTFVTFDPSNHGSSCDVIVEIQDVEPPLLQAGDCSSIDVVGVTDHDLNYGTEIAGSLTIIYPTISDNSGEALAVYASVDGNNSQRVNITGNQEYRFPYVGGSCWAQVGGGVCAPNNVSTTVMFESIDSTGLRSTCNVDVKILDNQPPTLVGQGDCGATLYGVTDGSKSFGTVKANSIAIVYPNLTDNSDETMVARAFVGDTEITGADIYPFPYVGVDGTFASTIRFVAFDSSGSNTSCETVVVIEDNQAPILENGDCSVLAVSLSGVDADSEDVSLLYPSVVDNSGEMLVVRAFVVGVEITGTNSFPISLFESQYGTSSSSVDITTTVTFNATDSSNHRSSCSYVATIDVDECASAPCMNGATCLNRVGKYECTCPLTHNGEHCENVRVAAEALVSGSVEADLAHEALVASLHLQEKLIELPESSVSITNLRYNVYGTIDFDCFNLCTDGALVYRDGLAGVFHVDRSSVTISNLTYARRRRLEETAVAPPSSGTVFYTVVSSNPHVLAYLTNRTAILLALNCSDFTIAFTRLETAIKFDITTNMTIDGAASTLVAEILDNPQHLYEQLLTAGAPVTGVMARVLDTGSCNMGTTISNSDRDFLNACEVKPCLPHLPHLPLVTLVRC